MVLYNSLFFIVIILGFPFIIPIVLLSEKRRKTVLQRLGLANLPEGIKKNISHKPDKKQIWVHALSVGEVISAVPFVKGLKDSFRNKKIFFSVSTLTGFEIADSYVKEFVDEIFFFPYDLVFSVKYIAGIIDPDIVIIVETDIWPNFLFEMKKRNVPVILVNTRLSKKSFSGYKRIRCFMEAIFLTFSKICTQSSEDAQRFKHLGVPDSKIVITGNFKFDQEYDFMSETEIQSLKQSINILPAQKIILAGSTHKGEESIILNAFEKIIAMYSDVVLIVAPRDPRRAESVCRHFLSAGFSAITLKNVNRRKQGEVLKVIVVDTIGLLTKLYAVADIAFVGGSLVNCGGHNPLEPAALSKPIIFGPDMSDFAETSKMLVESGGAVRVQNAESLYETFANLLGNRTKSQNMGKRVFQVYSANSGAVKKTIGVVDSLLQLKSK